MADITTMLLERLTALERRLKDLERREYTSGGTSPASLTVEEEDASPSVSSVDTIQVPNGTLTDDGGGTVSLDYAASAKGVTNGDSHDHAGGDGAQIDHTGLSNLNSASYTHLTGTNHTDLTDGGATTLHKHDHGGQDGLTDDDHTQYILAAGTRALSADWDAGSFEIRAQTLEADVTTGTAPLTIASTTVVTNLNADYLDGNHAAAFATSAQGVTNGDSHDHAGGDGAQVDHGGLGGLTDDDHTGYARLAGRSGGQTLQGGTASGDDLTLQSTAHATKGTIAFGTSGYDEVNNRLGIGATNPSMPLEVRTGPVGVGTSAASSFNTAGLVLNQGSADDEIISFKSSDVAHGVTGVTDTDTFFYMNKYSATEGGGNFTALSEGTVGLSVVGVITTADTTRATTSVAGLLLQSRHISGTGFGDASADENIIACRARVGGALRTIAILDEDGDWNYDGTAANAVWDEYDDVALLSGLRASVVSDQQALGERWQEWIEYARPILERTGVVHYNPDGHHFISTKYLNMLQIDAIRQLAAKVEQLQAEIVKLKGD